jgi:NAD(P)-dependent dehydrogenase (short-subunit alcohol dehydrogenase family)
VNRAALPQMRKQGSGLLLQIGSIAGRLALPYLGLYGATKFALDGLTESYRDELAPFGIDAAIIEPGTYPTTYPTTISTNRQVAADAERFALYRAGMDVFMASFYAENRSTTPPDPQEVADAVARVIALPAGARPLRTVVATAAQRQAPEEVNGAVAKATQSSFQTLHLPQTPQERAEEQQ